MITALSGSTRERKTIISSRKDRISTAPITTKSRLPEEVGGVDAAGRLPADLRVDVRPVDHRAG